MNGSPFYKHTGIITTRERYCDIVWSHTIRITSMYGANVETYNTIALQPPLIQQNRLVVECSVSKNNTEYHWRSLWNGNLEKRYKRRHYHGLFFRDTAITISTLQLT